MAIITLCSDWGVKDHYSAVVKGAILQLLPAAVIVEITHQVPPFNLFHASFVIRNAYPSFPPGTIHIIDIQSDTPASMKYLLVGKDNQYFITPDNGLISLVFDTKPGRVIEILLAPELLSSTFIARDLFAPIACRLANGAELSSFGKETEIKDNRVSFAPAADHHIIRAKVVYIDTYENVFLNVSPALFEKVGKGRAFTIYFRTLDYGIQKISQSYNDVPEGDILALFSSTGLLEIAMNKGNAAGLLGLNLDETVRIEFNG